MPYEASVPHGILILDSQSEPLETELVPYLLSQAISVSTGNTSIQRHTTHFDETNQGSQVKFKLSVS